MDEEQIIAFCKNLQTSLVDAFRRGNGICLSEKMFSKPVFDPEGGYGLAPVDAIYTGHRFIIDIGEPAEQKRIRDEREREALKERLGM